MKTLLDLDGHLQMDQMQLRELFGAQASVLPGMAVDPVSDAPKPKSTFVPADVWKLKGSSAYGASNAAERIEILDAMGVAKQLVLPRVRVALAAWHGNRDAQHALVERFNEVMASWQQDAPSRLYGVGILTMDDPARTGDQVKAARRLGLRALLIPCFEPPAGCSPASEVWEPVWKAIADANIALILHAGSEQRFIPREWAPDNAEFGFSPESVDLKQRIDVATVDMFKLLTLHYGPQTFMTALMVGGVLTRFPSLRFAIAELGASWVEPYLNMLDATVDEFRDSLSVKSIRPSEIFVRQVRVTPSHWEPVERYLRNSKLASIYCFSTDFPHSEGGQQTLEVAEKRLADLPPDTINGYFRENAKLILCD
jgi:predicted TIM-barrel fold metal-dependent hydrolase